MAAIDAYNDAQSRQAGVLPQNSEMIKNMTERMFSVVGDFWVYALSPDEQQPPSPAKKTVRDLEEMILRPLPPAKPPVAEVKKQAERLVSNPFDKNWSAWAE